MNLLEYIDIHQKDKVSLVELYGETIISFTKKLNFPIEFTFANRHKDTVLHYKPLLSNIDNDTAKGLISAFNSLVFEVNSILLHLGEN